MNDSEFELLDKIEETHWWFVGKRLILRALLESAPAGQRWLDLGCGTGGILHDWQGRQRCVGVDLSELALRICRRRGFATLARADLTALPFSGAVFDKILCLDVIEHLPDDVAFLRQASALCAPGGEMVIGVPAFRLLWSQHDETFQHVRRYSARQLEAVIRQAGLEPTRTTYTNSLLFPIALAWRLASYRLGLGRIAPKHDFWPLPRRLNAGIVLLYRLEASLLRRVNLPVGVSVVCVARAPSKPTARNPVS